MQQQTIIGNGSIGGKATGFFKAKNYLEREELRLAEPELSSKIKYPETFCITTDVFTRFLKDNQLHAMTQQYKWQEDSAYEILRGHFLYGKFAQEYLDAFAEILKRVDYPLAVRSSSMLEDEAGTSFAGKYETIFISNRGTLEERMEQLIHAIKEVYASTYSPSALQYRKKHDMLDCVEEMAILLQQAIGREYKGYFLPLMAGVGFSENGYCWNTEIKRSDGLARLVFGLGTRAVGRGYARIFSPSKPLSRPEGTDSSAITKFSQGVVDVLDLAANELKHVKLAELVEDGFNCYPLAQRLFSLKEENHLYIPSTNLWSKNHTPVLTFDGVLSYPWLNLDLPKTMKWLFRELETSFTCPVDIEFAIRVDDGSDDAHFYLLQSRPLSQREEMKPRVIPCVPDEDRIFFASKFVPTAFLENIEYIVYVDPMKYRDWPTNEKFAVARVIGKINEVLEKKKFILMGPGRWGSQNPSLGVPAKYAEIANTKMLVEISIKDADYLPEVSYGTHFFQDLIEDKIVYVPLYPDEGDAYLNNAFFEKADEFRNLLDNEYYSRYEGLVRVIHVPALTGGRFAEAIFDGQRDCGLVYVK